MRHAPLPSRASRSASRMKLAIFRSEAMAGRIPVEMPCAATPRFDLVPTPVDQLSTRTGSVLRWGGGHRSGGLTGDSHLTEESSIVPR